MNTIKNIHKLAFFVDEDTISKLEAGAKQHLRYSNITFKIIYAGQDGLTIRTEQGKSLSENYADEVDLIDLTRKLFLTVLGDLVIKIQPIIFTPAPTDVVTPEWIQYQMLNKGVRLKDIAADTGVSKSNLSPLINGVNPMSENVRAMFYYYFQNRIEPFNLEGKATEFRLGNIIKGGNHKAHTVISISHKIVEAIGIDDHTYSGVINPNDSIDNPGLPINENWLLNFGFVPTEARGCDVFKLGILHLLSSDSISYGCSFDPENNDSWFAEVRYVHQLQNLHFALTGEELTTKK